MPYLDGLHLAREAGIAATDAGWDRRRALLDHLEGIGATRTTGCGRFAASRRLGHTPQAFSLVGLVDTTRRLSGAGRIPAAEPGRGRPVDDRAGARGQPAAARRR